MSATVKVGVSESRANAQYAKPSAPGDGSTTERSGVEVPYTEYQSETKIPYTAKYLGVENIWEEREIADDIQEIEEYIGDQVNRGELKNDIGTVKTKLKSIEKMANIDTLESPGLRLIKLSSFIKYLKHLDGRMKNGKYI